jgi:hypothetical protein
LTLFINNGKVKSINFVKEKLMMEYSCFKKFFNCKLSSEFYLINEMFFEKIDTESYDGNFCQREWFTPLKKVKDGE